MTRHWNHLYNYADNNPMSLKDPTGLGAFEWLEDLFKEKARQRNP
jgi:hypothetical protein